MFTHFFKGITKKLVVPLTMTHSVAYLMLLIEQGGRQKIGQSDEQEGMFRFLILLAAFTAGKVSELAYPYFKQSCQQWRASRIIHHPFPAENEEVPFSAFENEAPSSISSSFHAPPPPTRLQRLKSFFGYWQQGFALTAGPASFLYAALPALGLSSSVQEIETLALISITGTVAGLGYGTYQTTAEVSSDTSQEATLRFIA